MEEGKGRFYNPNATREGLADLIFETPQQRLVRLLSAQHASDATPQFPKGDYSQSELRRTLANKNQENK